MRSVGQGLPYSPGLLGGAGTGVRRSPMGNDGYPAQNFCFVLSLRVSKLFCGFEMDLAT